MASFFDWILFALTATDSRDGGKGGGGTEGKGGGKKGRREWGRE